MGKRSLRAITAALLLAGVSLVVPGLAAPARAAADPATPLAPGVCAAFPQTGKIVAALFLDYWQTHGGLAQQGYPIENMAWEQSSTDGKPYVVQYFERAVFEWHPANAAPATVLLSLLGSFRYQERYPHGAPNQVPNTGADSVLFPQTGKRVGGAFLHYWQTHGGLAQQGYPLSDEFAEQSPLDGRIYRVQYFERAVFEWHPANAPPNDVLLSQLGRLRDQERYPHGWPPTARVAAQCSAIRPPPAPSVPAPAPPARATPPDPDGDAAQDGCPAQGGAPAARYDSDGCPQTLSAVLAFARGDITAYWQQVFASWHVAYRGPPQVLGYTQRIRTACGRAPLDDAFFCEQDRNIYYDLNLMTDQVHADGTFAAVTVLAHEWGHLIQADLGITRAAYPSIAIELQADCYAGAYARHASNVGLLEPDDLSKATASLFAAGDPPNVPAFAPDAHGQPQQRVDAFRQGYQQGASGCALP